MRYKSNMLLPSLVKLKLKVVVVVAVYVVMDYFCQDISVEQSRILTIDNVL